MQQKQFVPFSSAVASKLQETGFEASLLFPFAIFNYPQCIYHEAKEAGHFFLFNIFKYLIQQCRS
jgi:hypothetical protein